MSWRKFTYGVSKSLEINPVVIELLLPVSALMVTAKVGSHSLLKQIPFSESMEICVLSIGTTMSGHDWKCIWRGSGTETELLLAYIIICLIYCPSHNPL